MHPALRLAIPALALVACGAPTSQGGSDPPTTEVTDGPGAPTVVDPAGPQDDAARPARLAAAAGDDADDDEPVDLLAPTEADPPTASAPPQPDPPYTITPLATSKFLSKRDLALFNSVCQLAEDAEEVGCRCCPDQPAARWCADGQLDRQTSIEHVFYGAFSQPGVTEAVATGEGFRCGNLSAWGVSWFLRQEGTQWSVVRGASYVQHVQHGAVWPLADGRRGLVTHDIIGKHGDNAIAFTTFAPDGTPTRTELLGWSNSSCIHRAPGYYQSVVLYGGANPYDHNQDGTRDLVITLKVKRRLADAAFQQQCAAAFDQQGAPSPFDSAPTSQHVIPLHFDGSRFTVERQALGRFLKATAEVDPQGRPFEP